MALKQNQVEFQCTGCQEGLDLDSETLPCFHSFCLSCLDKRFEAQTNGNGMCPECQERRTLDQQLELADRKCNLCLEDGIESIAWDWCNDCQKLFCNNCSRFHRKFKGEFHRQHDMRDLNGTRLCSAHQKEKDVYCGKCNLCLCDICYQSHSADSPGCSSLSLSVREEVFKQKSQRPTLAKEIDDFESSLQRLNEGTKCLMEEMSSDCNSKCQQLWLNFEEMMENAKQKTNELCEDMRQITDEQTEKWRHLLEENEKILKQLEIWRINLRYLMSESLPDVDIVYGFQLVRSQLSSQLNKLVEPEKKCQLEITSSNWWLQVLEHLRSKKIGSVSLTVEKMSSQNLVFDKQWNLRGSNLWINSIHVSKKDDHVFICNSSSIIEYTERGDFVGKCVLFDGKTKLYPTDLSSISPDIFAVVCGWGLYENKLVFLERRETPPYLQVKRIIDTGKGFCSLCHMDKTIFACDWHFLIDSFSEDGEKTPIKTGESWCKFRTLIRVDPSTGNFWGSRENSSEIYCFNSNGEKLKSVDIREEITDFCVDEFGQFYFCNHDGFFLPPPLKKVSFRFEKKSELKPAVFVLRNKLFVSLSIDGKYLIKIFKILE